MKPTCMLLQPALICGGADQHLHGVSWPPHAFWGTVRTHASAWHADSDSHGVDMHIKRSDALQPAEPPALDGVSAQSPAAAAGPSVLGVDAAVSALTDAVDWTRLRHFSLPGKPCVESLNPRKLSMCSPALPPCLVRNIPYYGVQLAVQIRRFLRSSFLLTADVTECVILLRSGEFAADARRAGAAAAQWHEARPRAAQACRHQRRLR